MLFLWIFVGIAITLNVIAFMEAHGWPWLKKFNERRGKTDFWGALLTMEYDDQKFAEWLSRKGR